MSRCFVRSTSPIIPPTRACCARLGVLEFEKGTADFPYNPVSGITDCTVASSAHTTQDNRDLDSNMSYRKQHEYVLEIGQCGARLTNHRMKMLLKEYYGMKMHYFQPMPHHEWVNRVN